MMAAKFRQVFPVGKILKKCNLKIHIAATSGELIESKVVYLIPFEINCKEFVYNVHVLKHLSDDCILGINFFQEV
jgi:hypothetical protein